VRPAAVNIPQLAIAAHGHRGELSPSHLGSMTKPATTPEHGDGSSSPPLPPNVVQVTRFHADPTSNPCSDLVLNGEDLPIYGPASRRRQSSTPISPSVTGHFFSSADSQRVLIGGGRDGINVSSHEKFMSLRSRSREMSAVIHYVGGQMAGKTIACSVDARVVRLDVAT
jgi:hypothetical protein